MYVQSINMNFAETNLWPSHVGSMLIITSPCYVYVVCTLLAVQYV